MVFPLAFETSQGISRNGAKLAKKMLESLLAIKTTNRKDKLQQNRS